MSPDAGLLARIDAYIETHLEATIADLARLIAQPSVSAQRLGSTSARRWSPACCGRAASTPKCCRAPATRWCWRRPMA